MREASADEIAKWDELIAANPDGGNVLQSQAFAETKQAFGWKPFYALYEPSDVISSRVAVCYHRRRLPAFGELWYAPKGPGVADVTQFKAIAAASKTAGRGFVIKYDPEIIAGSERIRGLGLVRSRDIQLNTATILVNLVPGEEEILTGFKQKTRYNIRLAEKRGVVVRPVELTPEHMDLMYEMMRQTYQRAGVYARSKAYFETFWKLHAAEGRGQLFFAYLDDTVLAGAFVTYLGKKGLYKDGASTREHREVQAPYLLQWQIMRWLKERGVESYDLHGVPPADRLDDPTHKLQPLVQFKSGFCQDVTEFIGTYDLVLNESKYRLWYKVGERAAMSWTHRVKNELFY
jgi:lipid II:glycine glycyltransferase (peptidoglycan interpeptide bridge formation enzyme)